MHDVSLPFHYGKAAGTADDMPGSLLLVWDAPNVDMGLGAILGSRPTSAYRPRFDRVGAWLVARARAMSTAEAPVAGEATVFTNVSADAAEIVKPWVDALRNVGFAVFAKPKTTEDSDVDPDMLAHIRLRHSQGILRGVVVASADGRNFQELLETLAGEGIPVTVLGFEEHATWAVAHETIEFIDLEQIPGVFREPLPRISLDNLPPEGAWLAPLRPLEG